jgi:hypothetical protein
MCSPARTAKRKTAPVNHSVSGKHLHREVRATFHGDDLSRHELGAGDQ